MSVLTSLSKMVLRLCTVVFLLTLVASCTQIIRPNFTEQLTELRSGQYSLDVEHAYLHFKVQHLGLSTVVGRFNRVDGSLDFDPNNISQLVLEGQVDATSVDMNNDDLDSTLLGGDWFDAANHGKIGFVSDSAKLDDDGFVIIDGTLSLRGVSQAVVLKAKFNGGADNFLTGKYTLGFSATTAISRSAFGMDALGALVGDEVQVELFGEFQKN